MEKKSEGLRGQTDRRILDKMLIQREISPEELKKYTDTLPDVSDNMEEMIVEVSEETEVGRSDD